ncbi:hypothetical protein K438DRAFT_1080699 [Mycena galopus ATCC 62051]|nr:hypothetical protein K438DRAFT_1080699 [Mycena galopus ATCC 62051]
MLHSLTLVLVLVMHATGYTEQILLSGYLGRSFSSAYIYMHIDLSMYILDVLLAYFKLGRGRMYGILMAGPSRPDRR